MDARREREREKGSAQFSPRIVLKVVLKGALFFLLYNIVSSSSNGFFLRYRLRFDINIYLIYFVNKKGKRKENIEYREF